MIVRNNLVRVMRWAAGIVVMAMIASLGVFFAMRVREGRQTTLDPYETKRLRLNGFSVFVRVPGSAATQELGLAGVTDLPDNQGMLWDYAPSQVVTFWMAGMKIPLDFIWINDGSVIGVTPNVQPPASSSDLLPFYRPPSAVDRVLEVNAGFATEHHIMVGTKVTEFDQ